MNLILIRHGEIDSNVAKVYSGRSSEPLNSRGRLQAEQAAEKMCGLQVAALLTSPLRRALETANILGKQLKLDPQISESFNELRMGPWEGLSESEVESGYPDEFKIWNSRPADLYIEGRETLEELRIRAIEGVRHARLRYEEAPIAIVSHVAVIRILMLQSQGRSLNDYKSMVVPNATPIPIFLDPAYIGVSASAI